MKDPFFFFIQKRRTNRLTDLQLDSVPYIREINQETEKNCFGVPELGMRWNVSCQYGRGEEGILSHSNSSSKR